MTGPQHYAEAERILSLIPDATDDVYTVSTLAVDVAAAQVHATLALVAATALAPIASVDTWRAVAS